MADIRSAYPIVFSSHGGSRPHSKAYRDFSQKWGAIKTLYEIADEKIEKVEKIYQLYLADYLQYLSYMIEKADVDREEEAFQDQLRKAKSKH
jgi:hypothetical protein